jgi:hypothetical protein
MDLLGLLPIAKSKEFGVNDQVFSSVGLLQGVAINSAIMIENTTCLGQIGLGFTANILIVTYDPLDDIRLPNFPEQIFAITRNRRVNPSYWMKHGENSFLAAARII